MGRIQKDRLIAFFMLLPSLVLVAIFVYGFIGATINTSMTDANGVQQLQGLPANNIGFSNYVDLFTGPLHSRFRTDVVNTVFFTILFVLVCLAVGLFLAILLDQRVKGESFFRTIFLFPMALSFVVTGVVWKWLFNPGAGINQIPTFVGLPQGEFRWFISTDLWLAFNWQNVFQIIAVIVLGLVFLVGLWIWLKTRSNLWMMVAAIALLLNGFLTLSGAEFLLTQPSEIKGFNVALFSIVVAAGWQMSGYTMAMYLAGLRGIPEELREAARVDGASELAIYRLVVFPLLAPITLSAMIILGHISLKIFDLVYVLGGGDNLYIDMPGINMYFTTFRGQDYARGAAIAIVMLVMVAAVIVPYLWTNMRSSEASS